MLSPKSKAEAIKKQLLVINDLLKLPEINTALIAKKHRQLGPVLT